MYIVSNWYRIRVPVQDIIGADTVDDTRVQVHPPPVRLSLFEQRNQITGTRRLIVNKCIEQVNFRAPVVVVPHHYQPFL